MVGLLITNNAIHSQDMQIYFKDKKKTNFLYVRGFIGFIVSMLQYLGVILLPLGDAISLILISPILVVLMGWLYLGE